MKKGVFDVDSASDDEDVAELVQSSVKRKGRKMDELLSHLKRKHDAGAVHVNELEETTPSTSLREVSTNIVLKPLPQNVDEHVLLAEFGRFGPIGSIKIIWPRGDRLVSTGNTGFVAFMNRQDAETAMRTMGGIMFHGNRLSISWGDGVPLPSVALNTKGSVLNPAATRERLEDGPVPKLVLRGIGPDVVVTVPRTAKVRYVIDALAVYVARDGAEFEDAIKEKEANNSKGARLDFLFDENSAEHVYYKWRVWSLANGDTLTSWRVEPFLMAKDGALWIPPPTEHTQVENNEHISPGSATLSRASRARLQGILADISTDRNSIAAVTMFALENVDCCREVSRIISESVSMDSENIQRKLAVVYACSDILYNTTSRVPGASLYRAALQESLPDLFTAVLSSSIIATSRLTKGGVVQKLKQLVEVWREWHVVDDCLLDELLEGE